MNKSIKKKTNKRKTRSDKGKKRKPINKCKLCDYENEHKAKFRYHVLNNHASIEERKNTFTYYCDWCSFGTFSKHAYEVHCMKNKNHLRKFGNPN